MCHEDRPKHASATPNSQYLFNQYNFKGFVLSIADLLVPHIYAYRHERVYIHVAFVIWCAINSRGKEIFHGRGGVAWCNF